MTNEATQVTVPGCKVRGKESSHGSYDTGSKVYAYKAPPLYGADGEVFSLIDRADRSIIIALPSDQVSAWIGTNSVLINDPKLADQVRAAARGLVFCSKDQTDSREAAAMKVIGAVAAAAKKSIQVSQ